MSPLPFSQRRRTLTRLAVIGTPFAPLIRWLLVDTAALILCDLVLSGVRVDEPSDYLLGALGMEIPTLVWMLTATRWNLDESLLWNSLPGRIVVLAFLLLVPVLLMTAFPALLTAEWISPGIAINGFWTYLGACAITALLTLIAGKSMPLEYVRNFLRPRRKCRVPRPVVVEGSGQFASGHPPDAGLYRAA